MYIINRIKKHILIHNKYKKTYFLIFLILLVSAFLYIILEQLHLSVYEPVDLKKKIIVFGETCDIQNNKVSIYHSIGYQLAFDYINQNGGIDEYLLKIILLDDKYETALAADNAKLLVDYYNVLAIIGAFGTPTYISILDNVIKDRPIPIIGPYASGEVFRVDFNKYLIFMNSSLMAEIELTVKNMLKNSFRNISIIYQNDTYGILSYNLFITYILGKNYNFNVISTGIFERNSVDLNKCFETLFDVKSAFNYAGYKESNINNVQAVIVFASEKQIPLILGSLKKIKPTIAIYYNFFVGTSKSNVKFLKDLNKDNVYQTLLSIKSLKRYPKLEQMLKDQIEVYNKNNLKKITYVDVSLIQGFYSGLMIGEVLKQFKDKKTLNRETFIDMFYKMKYIDVYGLKVGPFEIGVSNEGLRNSELNQLQPDLTFKTIDTLIYDRHKK